MAHIPFLAGKDSLLMPLRSAEPLEIVEAIKSLEADKKSLEKHPNSRQGGEMSWEERKKKYDEFYEVLAEVAEERFSQDDYMKILRLAFS